MYVQVLQVLFLKQIVILGRKVAAQANFFFSVVFIVVTNRYGRLMWMHNGGIAEFERMKRKLQDSLPEDLFLFPQGNTDSEWAFALFLSFVTFH